MAARQRMAARRTRQNGGMAVTHIGLLRGINLAGKNRVAMADLRALVAELGHADVATYIQSGNVLFTAAPADADAVAVGQAMSAAIAARLGVTSPVVVVSRDELAQIIADNPYADEPDPRRVHAVLLSEPPGVELAGKLDAALAKSTAKGARDDIKSIGRTLYLHTPDGFGNSDLAATIMRIVSAPKAGLTGTARNWATMTKLLAMCG